MKLPRCAPWFHRWNIYGYCIRCGARESVEASRVTTMTLALLLIALTGCAVESIPVIAAHPAGEKVLTAVAAADYAVATSQADKALDRRVDGLLARCATDPRWRDSANIYAQCQALGEVVHAAPREDAAGVDMAADTLERVAEEEG